MVVLISGGSKGIGRACAVLFGQQKYQVVLFSSDPKQINNIDRELKDLGIDYLVKTIDINNLSEIKLFLSAINKRFGKIDVLINNAGLGLSKRFEKTSVKDFDTVIGTNYKGSFFLTQYALPYLQKNANIIFISSIHAEHPSLDPVYDGSKAALNNLTLNLALTLAPKNIRVNTIVPGHIDVQTNNKPRTQTDVPLGKRAGLPDDVAKACLFISDNNQARYITGVILPVTGGLHIPIAKNINF